MEPRRSLEGESFPVTVLSSNGRSRSRGVERRSRSHRQLREAISLVKTPTVSTLNVTYGMNLGLSGL